MHPSLPRKLSGFTSRFCSLSLALSAPLAVVQPAQAATLSSWRFEPASNQLEFIVEQFTQPTYSVLAQPPRIILDLPNTQLGIRPSEKTYSGSVRLVQVSQVQPGTARIIVEFAPDVTLDPQQVRLQRVATPIQSGPFRDRWVLRPFVTATTTPLPSTAVYPATDPSVQVPPLSSSYPDSASVVLPAETSAINRPSTLPSVSVPPLLPPPPPTNENARVSFNRPWDIFVPRGTELVLRYSGETVTLKAGASKQEVLLVERDIIDDAGNVVIPRNTPVIGRFETNRRGSRFIAQAITLFGQNVPLKGQSERYQEFILLETGQIVPMFLKEALR